MMTKSGIAQRWIDKVKTRVQVLIVFVMVGWIASSGVAQEQSNVLQDSLPSWRSGNAKKSLLDFIETVTRSGSDSFVPESDRIAVFDNDGTLWPENPIPFQLAFLIDELNRRAALEPSLASDEMVQAALKGDIAKLLAGERHDGLMRVVALTHAGMSTDDFHNSVQSWLANSKHPKFARPYDQLAYQPMLEVLSLLRAHGFKSFIVSGGGADFMRVWSERVYGIPAERVIGTTARTKIEIVDGRPKLFKTLEHLFVDDKEGKPIAIHQFIGRRPIACFGNSDGDHAMLRYTTIGNRYPSFGLLVHHTDAAREYAYDVAPKSTGKLVDALQDASKYGWTVVDMRNDWLQIFSSISK